jgi:hypothetical protein
MHDFSSKRWIGIAMAPNLFASSLQGGSWAAFPVPARHVSRWLCQGVKESRLIDQARLWRPHARLPPALLFAAGKDPLIYQAAAAEQ